MEPLCISNIIMTIMKAGAHIPSFRPGNEARVHNDVEAETPDERRYLFTTLFVFIT